MKLLYLPLHDRGLIWHARVDAWSTCTGLILSGSVNCVAVKRKKPQIWPYFQFQHSVMALPNKDERRCTTGTKIISIFQRLHGEVFSTNSAIQKHNLTTPLSGTVCHPLTVTCTFNMYIKFGVFAITIYEDA